MTRCMMKYQAENKKTGNKLKMSCCNPKYIADCRSTHYIVHNGKAPLKVSELVNVIVSMVSPPIIYID